MKVKSVHNSIAAFSTLEIIMALAIMVTVLVGAVNANLASQYWSMTSVTATEGLYKAKTIIETNRSLSERDFYAASTTLLTLAKNSSDPIDATCIDGGLCYATASYVTDISSCSKYVEAAVSWQLAPRYPTSTVSLFTNLTSNDEIIASGGDCVLNTPAGDWLATTPVESGSLALGTANTNGMDVLQKKLYVVTSQSPQLSVYSAPTVVGQSPTLLGTAVGDNMRLNAVDAIRDAATGRIYAYVTVHASTSQLAVFDVTDASLPSFVTKRSLSGVISTGSFPEGWRVVAYGNRVYVTARETSGPELHIFNTNQPTQPSEVVGAATELNRTVNDMVVRDQMYGGVLRRYLFAAASAGLKELAVLEVTNDSVSEAISVDLPGSVDARSIALTGNQLYVGRANNPSGPELFVFDVRSLLGGNTTPLATSEVGTDVTSLRVSGGILFVGTTKTGEEVQVWRTDTSTWNSSTANSGRVSFFSFPRLAPLGIDIGGNFLFAVSQSSSQTEYIKILRTL